MALCRACLSTETGLNPIDLQFVESFNLLTGIHISYNDSLYACKACSDTVQCFIDFRGKCIEADSRFQDIMVAATGIKQENGLPLENSDYLEREIKHEENIKFEFLPTNGDCTEDYCSEVEHEEISRNKSTKKRKSSSSDGKVKIIISKSKKKCNEEEITDFGSEKLTNNGSKIHCGLCEEKFNERSELNNHLEYHKSLFDTQISCNLCTERFVNLPHMLGHRIDHVPYDQKICHL